MYVSGLFKLIYLRCLLRRFNFIRYKKQHVKLLLLRCFFILLLNWDIRLPSLCSFHRSHRKIRANTRISTLFQLTTTRLKYHVTFTIAVVIKATEKQFLWHKWLQNEISHYAHYAVLLHWLHSLRCLSSLLLKRNLRLHSLRCFNSLLLKWNIWLRSLWFFYFHYY